MHNEQKKKDIQMMKESWTTAVSSSGPNSWRR